MRVLQSCVIILVHIASLLNQQASASDSDSDSRSGVNIGTPERKLTESCVDEWYDSGGRKYNCAWYKENSSHCTKYGHKYANFGRTANEACCTCGGGGSPNCDSPFLSTAVEVLIKCFIDRSCDSAATNSAVKWFIDADNHPDDLGTDEQVWKERLVLAVFYYSTGGDQWGTSTNWLDANDHSTWWGLTTDSSTNYVEELDLYNNALNGTIPAEIGNLTSLTYLALDRNDLSGTIPAEFGHLTSLTILYLFGNALSGTIPAEIGNLTSLTYLILDGNDLTGSVPDGVCDLPSAFLVADCKNCDQSKPDCCSQCT